MKGSTEQTPPWNLTHDAIYSSHQPREELGDHPHFTDEETKAQKDSVAGIKTQKVGREFHTLICLASGPVFFPLTTGC